MFNYILNYLIIINLIVIQSIHPISIRFVDYDDEWRHKDVRPTQIGLKLPDVAIKPTPKQLCEFCNIVMPVVKSLVEKKKTKHVDRIVEFFCNEFKVVDKTVCNYIVKQYELVAMSVLQDSPLTAQELCDLGLDCGKVNNSLFDWNITLPNVPKPPVQPLKPPKNGAPKLRILQLTDVHIDFEYQPGSHADCLDPLCCRNQSTPRKYDYEKPNETGAGYWGDYRNCDVPRWTVENMFEYIANNEQFDFIYWTGDLPPHNVWNQTRHDQLHALNELSLLFKKYFSDKIIYPTLGNHEATPANLFPPPFVKEDNINWLYSALADNWTSTGLPSDLYKNITNGAFYTLLLYPGIRLISLNMNYCASKNFWLLIDSYDPLGQLDWLANVLQYSELNGEKVHIIGHIYPSGCLATWSSNYYRIVNRYESTIAGQFFGHSHNDQFELFYDLENITRATGIAYISPSVTTFAYLNPGYRIYTIDGFYSGTSFQVLDHETRFLNLTEANQIGKPIWRHEYSAKEAFGLENLFPQDWSNLIESLLGDLDSQKFADLYSYFFKSSDAIGNCDNDCKVNFLCSFKQANSAITIPCEYGKKK